MKLGKFSVSLAVKDIALSKAFYEKFGFEAVGGDQEQGWLVLDNEGVTIGLFQGMFEKNIMTFNPGWGDKGAEVNPFDDVRKIEQHLKDQGVEFTLETKSDSTGPAHFVLEDPDGNQIMFDQHR